MTAPEIRLTILLVLSVVSACILVLVMRWWGSSRRVLRDVRKVQGPSASQFLQILGSLSVGAIGFFFYYISLAEDCNAIRDDIFFGEFVGARLDQKCVDWYALVAFSALVFVIVLELLRVAWRARYAGVSIIARRLHLVIALIFVVHLATALLDLWAVLGVHFQLE